MLALSSNQIICFYIFNELAFYFRTLQYTCKLVGWGLKEADAHSNTVKKLATLESQASTARKCKNFDQKQAIGWFQHIYNSSAILTCLVFLIFY